MITAPQAAQLMQLIEEHVQAQIDLSWQGTADPTDRVDLQDDAAAAQSALDRFIGSLITAEAS